MKESAYKQFSLNIINMTVRCKDMNQVIDYISKQTEFAPLTPEQWKDLFKICKSDTELAKWIIKGHYDLSEDAIELTISVSDKDEVFLQGLEGMKAVLEYIYENSPEEFQAQILGTAFVLACKHNNLYLIKWLLEQGADVDYSYENQTGMDAALANIRTNDGIEDKTIVNYLQNNMHKACDYEDIQKYYRNRRYEAPKKVVNKLLSDSAFARANRLLEHIHPNLLQEETSAEELHLFMEEYNWDDGLEVPYFVMLHPNCELATALMIFWLAEGDFMFEDNFESMYDVEEVEWKYLLTTLHDRIEQGKYKVGKQHYQIPISTETRDELKAKAVNEIFITDL